MTKVCLSCGHVQHRDGDSCEKCWADNLSERPQRQRPRRAGGAALSGKG